MSSTQDPYSLVSCHSFQPGKRRGTLASIGRIHWAPKASLFFVVALALALGACAAPPPPTPTAPPTPPPSKPTPAASQEKPAPAASPTAAATPSPAPAKPKAELKPLKIALPTKGVSFTYVYVAKALGVYEEYGFDAQLSVIQGAPATAALISREVDLMAAIGSATRAALRGMDIRVVMVASNRPDHQVMAAKGITDFAQLKGKVLAGASPLNTVNVVLTELMSRKGFPPNQYQMLNAGDGPSRAATLTNGIASATLLESAIALPFQKQGYPVLVSAGEIVELPFTGMAASRAALRDKRDFIRSAVEATLKGVEVVRTQKDRVLPVLVKEFGLSAEDALFVYNALQLGWTTDGKPTDAALRFEFENAQKELELKEPVKLEQVYDLSLLDEIRARR